MDDYTVELDTSPDREQDEEVLTVLWADGSRESMRLHEYDRVYAIPGLYDEVVQARLKCDSPRQIVEGLAAQVDLGSLRILDVGAGNGVLGEALRAAGATGTIVGTDISAAGAAAAERDRPGLYAEYVIDDLGAVDVDDLIERHGLNCLVGAGALGHGHIAWEDLERIWRLFGAGSWLGITALPGPDVAAFAAAQTGLAHRAEFTHRVRMSGEPITYEVLIAGTA